MTIHINNAFDQFRLQYPDIGIEHYNHWLNEDENYYVLGLDAGWSNQEGGNGMEWFQKCVRTDEVVA